MPTDDDGGLDGAERTRAILKRIADLLGCDPSALADGGLQGRGHETVGARELVLAWLDIEDPDDRRRVVDLARALSRSSTKPGPDAH
ncbi:hypothetical protein [Methylobacterium sp. WL12]|uniref:hypothetical protein n=1 Tax=Methylobacterium sp. WL12 TaxID=2603890 RepID=UPI0011C98BD1|nr:hypothetical protein [Methylobacterium sp. WL12]